MFIQIELPVFRADSPMRGRDMGLDAPGNFLQRNNKCPTEAVGAQVDGGIAAVHVFVDETERTLRRDFVPVCVTSGVLHQFDAQHASIATAFHTASDHEGMFPIAEIPRKRRDSGSGNAEFKPDKSGQLVEVFVPGHGAAQLMQHEPGGLVRYADPFGKRDGADRPEGKECDGGEPFSQGDTASLHDGPGNERTLTTASCTSEQRKPASGQTVMLRAAASRTPKSVGPARLHQQIDALLLRILEKTKCRLILVHVRFHSIR